MQGDHSGHRKRLKDKVAKFGFECLYPHEMLEYILYSAIPRKDTNQLAHDLINAFGSYEEVFTKPVEELMGVKGVGQSCALVIKSYSHHANTMMGIAKENRIRNLGEARAFFKQHFKNSSHEEFHMVLLGEDGVPICHEIYTDSENNHVVVPVDSIMQAIFVAKPKIALFAHNHPSGSARPSVEDVNFTNKLWKNIEKYIGITNCEHLIFTSSECYSFRHNGLLNADGKVKK